MGSVIGLWLYTLNHGGPWNGFIAFGTDHFFVDNTRCDENTGEYSFCASGDNGILRDNVSATTLSGPLKYSRSITGVCPCVAMDTSLLKPWRYGQNMRTGMDEAELSTVHSLVSNSCSVGLSKRSS